VPFRFQLDQRWISETEPELGLGRIEQIAERTVTVVFAASDETRQYALDNAPLRRVQFHKGDRITRRDGTALIVEELSERNGIIFYRSGNVEFPESELSDRISFSGPEERLFAGQTDPTESFDLRFAALEHQYRRRKSSLRGFMGGRIDLIPHQLYIASEVAGRLVPRVLLADEVGLGKTIEACLILHRLIQTRRAQRVLIMVPEPLIHQWFVELLRRFNLWFHIFDEDRCDAIETSSPEANPFLENQWVLCGIDFLARNSRRQIQAVAAGWEVLVVDEAHHLGWGSDGASPEYAAVEALGSRTPALLLLTATPEQLGLASHFARLRLLDADRYCELDQFLEEAEDYQGVAAIANKLLHGQTLDPDDVKLLARIFSRDEREMLVQAASIEAGDTGSRKRLIDDLLDQHGTGRVMFRNTRATMAGFPRRLAQLYPLAPSEAREPLLARLAMEFAADTDTDRTAAMAFEPAFVTDPRITWLAELLRRLAREKVLLICRSQSKVAAIAEALSKLINVKAALFHEGLPLVQRDRNAAWFAEDDGARILLASEIGSEGRNFQFAHHLVLFDLPLDPEILEQRIGRLDRIGQSSDIHIHVPFVAGSPQEVLVRWFHEGLNAFEKHLRGGRQILEQFGARAHDLAQDFHETQPESSAVLEHLISQTRAADQELTGRLEQGRDRLLELNSCRPEEARQLVNAIRQEDHDRSLDSFMLAVFDHFGIQVEEFEDRTYHLGSAGVFADTFPGLPEEGLTVTSSRQCALFREDRHFLTWDHPLVTGALDLVVGSELGNSSFAHWPDSRAPGLYLEAIYLLECVSPPHLHLDRFLPPTPLRVVVDQHGKDAGAVATPGVLAGQVKNEKPAGLLDQAVVRQQILPNMLAGAEAFAGIQVAPLIARARSDMAAQLEHEIGRLRDLQKFNRSVRPEEVDLLVAHQRALDENLTGARLRLDAVRLIRRGPAREQA
jgi:ATP-dependent helicase HepA